MIKIFQLITSIQVGGAENVALRLAENCTLAYPGKFEFIIFELYRTDDEYSRNKWDELIKKNVRVITLGGNIKKLSLLIAPIILLSNIKKNKPAIIHSHTDLPDFVLATAYRVFPNLNAKICRTIHNTELWSTHPKIGRYTESTFNDDTIIGVSEAALQAYKNIRNKNELPISNNIYKIYNGCPVPVKTEHSFKINHQTINIAFCGRLEYQKGIDVLLNRIKLINEKYDGKITFHIIGNGSFRNAVKKLADMTQNVIYYESVNDLANKIYAFDYMIMPSRFEGLVLSSIEASLSRVPVIAAFAPGLSETLPESWPLKFHLESEDELLVIFDKIVKREYELDSLKEDVYRFVLDKFSQDKMIDEYSKIYLSYGE